MCADNYRYKSKGEDQFASVKSCWRRLFNSSCNFCFVTTLSLSFSAPCIVRCVVRDIAESHASFYMFRSKFSILLSISYVEKYENMTEERNIIIRSTKVLRNIVLIIYQLNIDINCKFSLKYNINCNNIIYCFFNNTSIFSRKASVSSLIICLGTHQAIYVNEGTASAHKLTASGNKFL